MKLARDRGPRNNGQRSSTPLHLPNVVGDCSTTGYGTHASAIFFPPKGPLCAYRCSTTVCPTAKRPTRVTVP